MPLSKSLHEGGYWVAIAVDTNRTESSFTPTPGGSSMGEPEGAPMPERELPLRPLPAAPPPAAGKSKRPAAPPAAAAAKTGKSKRPAAPRAAVAGKSTGRKRCKTSPFRVNDNSDGLASHASPKK